MARGGRDGTDPAQPPRQASLATPPQEGNWWRGAVEMVQTRHNHPVRLRLPPLRRRGIVCLHRRGIAYCRYDATTPSGFACHPSAGGELVARSGRDGTEPTRPPRQASPATPLQEGNWWHGAVEMVQNPHDHLVRLRLPPLHKRGITCLHGRGISWYRTHATTPSGFAAACKRDTIAVVYLY